MSHYVIVDGQLQRSSPETSRWVRRAALGKPVDNEEKPDAVVLVQREYSDWEILEGMEEHEDEYS